AFATATPTFFLPEPTQTTTVQGTPQPTATLENYPVYPTVGETGYPEWPTPNPTESGYPNYP
ncbi:MAG: hypothetical protein K0B14_18950, partial [Anaerolineaceae bacterium]|nr:hypothetical protein [Anaerolineaceae bacterium]